MRHEEIPLPEVRKKSEVPLEVAIQRRRSVRHYRQSALNLHQISQLLWSAQGMTERGYRTVPSAGATYPLKIFLVAGQRGVEGLPEGIYHYQPETHSLALAVKGDHRNPLCSASLGQEFIQKAPLSMVIVADYSRTTRRYGDRGRRYVLMEAGHVGQNVSLQAVAMGLATVMVGAFRDEEVATVMRLSPNFEPLYVIPIGYPNP
jgi:SagB-type dehydrogenase family enzyme